MQRGISTAVPVRAKRRKAPATSDCVNRAGPGSSLKLTGAFELVVDGESLEIPLSCQRVLAYLGLTQTPVTRSQCAGALWEYDTEERARRNLRTALWRLSKISSTMLIRAPDRLALIGDLLVDVGELVQLCHSVIQCDGLSKPTTLFRLLGESVVLPTWSDEWVLIERERLRLLRMQALEQLATQLAGSQPAAALMAAMAAVRTEPLQESAWRLVIEINQRQGNVAAAVRAYDNYRSMLRAELRMEPSEMMTSLVGPLLCPTTAQQRVRRGRLGS